MPELAALVEALEVALQRDGFAPAIDDAPDLVLNLLADEAPRPFRLRSIPEP